MRLLETTTIDLHEFFDDYIPAYAILSHTWGDGEISYQSLEQAKIEVDPRPGYVKIRQCCDLARSENYQYLWIDTCCIDKTSSAELSEAINSMYRWYRDSAICYAYLKDVSQTSLDDESSVEAWCASRWFMRGWTLQELLAPEHLVFFNQDWVEIGSKIDLEMEIHLATGIEPRLIRTPNIACVAQKMSWASKRWTTRHEDRSYCLMGLFDVQMPLLYGEGGPKAFLRLQYEIAKQSDDESLFAWNDSSLLLCGVFAPSPEAFADSSDVIRAFNHKYPRKPWSVTNRGLAIEINNTTAVTRVKPFFHVLLLHCCRRKHPNQPFCVRLWQISSDSFSRLGQGELTLQDQMTGRAPSTFKNWSDIDRRIVYIPQERARATNSHTVFVSRYYDGKVCTLTRGGKNCPFTSLEPFESEQDYILWDKGSQTLTMLCGTAEFYFKLDSFSFLMALTVPEHMQDGLNFWVRSAGDSAGSYEMYEIIGRWSAARINTYSGRLSPKHKLAITIRRGSDPREGLWSVDINVTLCKPQVPDNSQAQENGPSTRQSQMTHCQPELPDNSQALENGPSTRQSQMTHCQAELPDNSQTQENGPSKRQSQKTRPNKTRRFLGIFSGL